MGYLNSLPTSSLVSYFCIGLATLNKSTLNLVVKTFPYLPMPLIKFFVSKIYCGGDNAKETIATGKKLAQRGINNVMISFTLEDAEGTKNLDINHIVDETIKSIDDILIPHTESVIRSRIAKGGDVNDIPAGYVALKPSALVEDPKNVMKNYKINTEGWNNLVNNCSKICQHIYQRNEELSKLYPTRNSPMLVAVVDAEKYDLQQAVYILQRELFKKFNTIDRPPCVVGTIQMYLKQSFDVLINEINLGKEEGYKIGMKLVRGAYIHNESDRNVIHNTKEDTDSNYNKAIHYSINQLLDNNEKNPVFGHLVIASHNKDSMKNATEVLKNNYDGHPLRSNITLAQLLGMADDITFDLIENHQVTNIIKYVPWGPPLETKDYLLRRLEENGDAVRNDNGWPLVKGVTKTLWNRIF